MFIFIILIYVTVGCLAYKVFQKNDYNYERISKKNIYHLQTSEIKINEI